jgi:hypothetical protein
VSSGRGTRSQNTAIYGIYELLYIAISHILGLIVQRPTYKIKVYKPLDPGDAVSFAIPLTFKEQGLYSFQIILTGQSPLGKSTNFFSPVINYGWIEVGEFSGITIRLSDLDFNVVSCQ